MQAGHETSPSTPWWWWWTWWAILYPIKVAQGAPPSWLSPSTVVGDSAAHVENICLQRYFSCGRPLCRKESCCKSIRCKGYEGMCAGYMLRRKGWIMVALVGAYLGFHSCRTTIAMFCCYSTSIPSQDICEPLGFLRFLWCILNMRRGGVAVAGVLCSAWSIVNRS